MILQINWCKFGLWRLGIKVRFGHTEIVRTYLHSVVLLFGEHSHCLRMSKKRGTRELCLEYITCDEEDGTEASGCVINCCLCYLV